MQLSIYSYSLCIALPLMLFFGFYFLFAKTPEKTIFENYLRSRRIMGIALLLLAANYSVHFFFGIRFEDVNAAILMNLSTYFLCYWLFSSALTTLLDRFYITRWRLRTHLGLWVLFSILSGVILLLLPDGTMQKIGLVVMAAWLIGYGLFLVRRLLLAYYKAVRIFNDTHSDDIGSYIRWMSVFTWWAVIFGISCGLLTFLPDEWVFVWILSSVPFYIYLYYCLERIGVQLGGETTTYILRPGQTLEQDGYPLYWTNTAPNQPVTAWYPATDGTLDLRDQTNGLAYLLHGTGTGDYRTPVTLTFTHRLAKVRVTPSDAIGDNEVTSLQLYTYKTCTYNQGKVVQGTAEGWIEMKKCEYNGVTCWEANVVPGYAITKLMANNDGEERTLSAAINPVAGSFYNITLNNDKGFTIDAQGNYNVYSEAGLKAWAEALQDNNSLNIILTDDITLTPPAAGESNWSPKWGYDGVFDGNGKTITGLTIEYGTATYAGLFGTLGENGKVKNLTLKNVNITAASYTGAVAGRNNGTIENCSVSGTVKSSSNNAGGITGYNNGTITGCSASGSVSANANAGGIVGYLVKGSITDCHSSTTVEGNYSVGGVAGYMDSNTTLTTCISTGSVTATGSGEADAGGVVGNINAGATVTACYATGNITATQGRNAGGVAGFSVGIITACYHATGKVSGSARVGGVLGCNQAGPVASGTVTACYWDNNQNGGIGEDQIGNGETTKMEGSTTWETAKAAMNAALNGKGWKYVTGSGDAPLTLQKQ